MGEERQNMCPINKDVSKAIYRDCDILGCENHNMGKCQR